MHFNFSRFEFILVVSSIQVQFPFNSIMLLKFPMLFLIHVYDFPCFIVYVLAKNVYQN